VSEEGNLVITTPFSTFEEQKPIAYQDNQSIKVNWVVNGNIIGFEMEHWDQSKILVIDPVVRQWGTYLGGSDPENINGVDTDPLANSYVTGMTQSSQLIATNGTHQNSIAGVKDAFVVKFNSWGQRQWGTYFGGTVDNVGQACSAHESSSIFIIGTTNSTNGIATSSTYQSQLQGSQDAFVAKIV